MPCMARHSLPTDDDADDWVDQGSRLLNLLVRASGFVLLGVGFFVALMVIASAWSLYEQPARIEAFAREIERGSNLDLTLSQAVAAGREQVEADLAARPEFGAAAPPAATPAPGFRLSYFIAWLLAILLLLLIGRLALGAVRTGGELALYDVKVGKLARALLRERQR